MANHPNRAIKRSPVFGLRFQIDPHFRAEYRSVEYAAAAVDGDEAARQNLTPEQAHELLDAAEAPDWMPAPPPWGDATGWPNYEKHFWSTYLQMSGRRHDGMSRYFVPRECR